MTPEEWHKVKEVLQTALDLDPLARETFLDSACAGQKSLRSEVESLLESHDGAFLEQPVAIDPVDLMADTAPEAGIRRRLGPYELLEQIGEGGMGAVYRAVRADGLYDKQVAIKLICAGLATDFFFERFRNERQILAALEHPNIARLLDGGVTEEGLPYVVLEFVAGMPIDEYCARHDLPIADRLKLFRTVCSAVQYAHQNLVVHRDLKPGNILVTEDGVPKLLDFGIAKILDPEKETGGDRTLTVMRIMTPDFASPEQVRGDPITTASDVYSLGVILYLLLAGRRPYRVSSTAPHEIIKAICDTDPEKPSNAVTRVENARKSANVDSLVRPGEQKGADSKRDKLRRALSGDLDNIVLKALRKEPERRYATVEQFSEDIRRHLEHLPVIARKDTPGYRASKFVLRHRSGVAAAAGVALALITALAVTIREGRIAQAERARAERRFNDVRALANSLIFEIHDSIQNLPGATPARKLLLDHAVRYLDSLAKESGGDLSLQRELATGYQRIGLLQGNTRDSNLGETEAAFASLQKSLDILQSVAKANPSNISDQLNLASAHRIVSAALENSGRPGARSEALQALAITEIALRAHRSDTDVLRERGLEFAELAFSQDESGDAAGAAQSLRNALEIHEGLLKNDLRNRKLQSAVAANRVRLASQLVTLGFRKEALQVNSSGLDLYESLAKDPTDARSRRQLAVVLWFRGCIFLADGNGANALEIFRRSLAILEGLERTDPKNVLYQLDVAGATASVGRALGSSGKPAEGLSMLQKAIGIYEDNYARDQSYTDIPYWLGQNHIWRGEILSRAGDARGALEEYRKGASKLERLMLGAASSNVRSDIAESYVKVASALFSTGQPHEAVAAYQKALELAEPLASSQPPNILALYAVADAYSGMGEVSKAAIRRADWPSRRLRQLQSEVCEWYRKSTEAWRKIPNPARLTPSGFSVGNPDQAAKNSRDCDTVLARLAAPNH